MFEHLRKMAQRHHRAVGRDDVEIRARITLRGVSVECAADNEQASVFLEEMRAVLEEARPLMPVGTLPIEMTFAPVPMLASGERRLDSVLTEVRMSGMTLPAPTTEAAEKSLSALRAMCADLGPAEMRPGAKSYRGPGRRPYIIIETPAGSEADPVVVGRVNAVGPAAAVAKHLSMKTYTRSVKEGTFVEMVRSGALSRLSVTEDAVLADELFSFDEPKADPETPEI